MRMQSLLLGLLTDLLRIGQRRRPNGQETPVRVFDRLQVACIHDTLGFERKQRGQTVSDASPEESES